MARIVKIADMSENEKKKWLEQVENRIDERQNEVTRANNLFNELAQKNNTTQNSSNIAERNARLQQAENRINTYNTNKRESMKQAGETIKQENLVKQQLQKALEEQKQKQINQINENFLKYYSPTVTLPTANKTQQNIQNSTLLPNLKVSNEPIQELKDSNVNKILGKGEFEDGYQFGDVSKTLLGTYTDLNQDLLSGYIKPLENVGDVATNALATAYNLQGMGKALTGDTKTGFDYIDAAKNLREFSNKNLSEDISNVAVHGLPLTNVYDYLNKKPEDILKSNDKSLADTSFEKSSVLGEYPDKINNLIGYTAGQSTFSKALPNNGNVPIPVLGKTFNMPILAAVGGASGGLEEANAKDANEIERWTKALSGAGIEGTTEGMFGFFGVGGNEITDMLGEKAASKFKSGAAKTLAKMGFQATGESTEEITSYLLNYIVDNNLVDKLGNADFKQQFDPEQMGEEAILALVSTLISGGGASVVENNQAIKSEEQRLGRKLTNQERAAVIQSVINEEFSNTEKKLPLNQTKTALQQTQQQTTLPTQKMAQNQTSEQLPVYTQKQAQNYKNQAENEIKNAKINENDKNMMLDVLNNMQEVSQNDLQDIKTQISQMTQVTNEMNKLPTKSNYREDSSLKQKYMQYKNDTGSYDTTAVDEVLDITPTNRNGKRTVKQWTQVANEIGQRIADLSNEEIERIAYKSWFDVQPTKNITQYDNQAKKNVRFSRLDSDTWINNIYDGVNKARENTQQVQQKETKQESTLLKDKEGNVLKVYHGSPNSSISQFDSNLAGRNTQSDFSGIFFTDNPNIAEDFSYEQLPGNSNLSYKRGKKGSVYEKNLSYKNALNLNDINESNINQLEKYLDEKKMLDSKEETLNMMKQMANYNNAQGVKFYLDLDKVKNDYDLIIADMGGTYKGSNEYIVFDNSQIKNIEQKVENNLKQQQLDIIKNTNPMTDDYHQGIRNINDIKTFEEAMKDDESFVYGDFTLEDAEKALEKGKVTVYSSHPIEQGSFVSTSQNMAKDYAGNGQIYSQEVNLDDVAWINGDEGQYAKLNNNIQNLEQRVSGDDLLNAQDLINDIKDVGAEVDDNGYVTLYHRTTPENAKQIYETGKMKALEDGLFFSTNENGENNSNYGDAIVKLKMPAEKLELNDIFDDEASIRVPLDSRNEVLDVSNYLENNQNTLYNNNESESETNESINREKETTDLERNTSESELFEKRKQERLEKYREWEKSIKSKQENKLNNEEIELRNYIKNNDGKNVIFIDTDNGLYYAGGSLDNPDIIYINTEKAKKFGLKRTGLHEVMESNIRFADETSKDIIISTIDDIINDKSFESQKTEFWKQQEGEIPDDTAIAKDLICDRYAELKGEELDYKNVMPEELNNRIDMAIEYFNNQNSNKGSFNLPMKQQAQTKTEPVLPMTENQKFRKHYKSVIDSQYTTDEAKKVSKELMKSDTYVPESNTKQLERADQRIQTSGADTELNSLMSRAMTNGNINADDIAVGERLIQYYSKTGNKAKLQEAIQATAMAGTTAGQTVQAMSLLNHQTPEGQAVWLQRSVEKMNNDLKKRRGQNADQFNLTPEMQQKILSSENAEQLQQNLNEVYDELGQQVSKSVIEKIDAWRYFSMLANPKTHIRNIVGNVAMGKVQSLKNKVAGAIEGTVAQFNPDIERTHTIKPASKEVKQFAKNDIKNVADRLELNENKYNPKTRLENSMRTFKSNVLENTLGKLFELNNKALEAEDALGLKAAYTKSLSEYMTANNLTPDTITDSQLAKARNYAIEQAKEATFHQASAIATALNQFSNKNKLTKFISDAVIPFKKTPVNIAKAGLEYSPVGLAKSAIYDTVQLNKGNITVNQYIDNISKGLTGTGITLLGYALAEAGILKASGEDDKDKENYDKDRGSQSYSIQIGNNTYTLDWLAPTGIPLFIGAEIHNIMQQDKETKTSTSSDDDAAYNQAINSATNILDAFTNAMNPMTEMSMLSGLTNALKSYDGDNAKMLANLGVNTSKSYVNQYVPTALGQIAKTTDEYERSTTSTKTGTLPKAIDSTKNQIMAKIPGLRQMLPTKTDVWGNDLKQPENEVQRALENAVLPYTRKEIQNSDVDKELTRLYDNTGDSGVLPDSINKNLTINKEKYVMTSEEYAKYKKLYGQTAYKLIDNLVNSSDYKKMTDEQKETAIENVYKYANEQIKIDYAKENGINYDASTLSNVINSLSKSDADDYFEFAAKTKDISKSSDKIKALADSNYTNKSKQTIYENSLGKDDSLYDTMKLSGINIDEYLKYKSQEFTSDKTDDGTTSGKTVSGSKKAKVVNYVENMNITDNQKLLLLASQYSLTSSEKTQVANYVNSLNTTKANKLKIYESLSGFTVYKDGRVTW